MAKVIAFFNHKGGVGKTTTVHNLGYGLAKLGKKVLLIDADPQMNLTAAVYGLSTKIEYTEEIGPSLFPEELEEIKEQKRQINHWKSNNEKYTSLDKVLRNILLQKEQPINLYHDEDIPLSLLRGSIELNSLDMDMHAILQNPGNALQSEYFSPIMSRLDPLFQQYDFVFVDLSPSASSGINAIFSLTASYVIIPATPTFFSLQAVNNLVDVWKQWRKLLAPFQETVNTEGLKLESKFLGMIVQQGKRFKGGNATHTNEWKKIINEGIRNFVNYPSSNSISEETFTAIFNKSQPYIIDTYNNFTDKLRSIAEKKGVPFVALTESDLPASSAEKETDRQYFQSWKMMQATNKYICERLLNLP